MPEPRPLRDEINKLLARRGYGRLGGDESLAAAWRDVMAAAGQSADGTRTLRLSRRTLHIGVAHAARRSELDGYHKQTLLDLLASRHPALDVRQLRFELLRSAPTTEDEGWMSED